MADSKHPLAIEGLDADLMYRLSQAQEWRQVMKWAKARRDEAVEILLDCNLGTDLGINKAARMQERIQVLQAITSAPAKAMEYKADDERTFSQMEDEDTIRDGNAEGRPRLPQPDPLPSIRRGV